MDPSVNDDIQKDGSGEPLPIFVIVMGVSGTGKSTLGHALAHALGMPYIEGDDLHPQSNLDKMADGFPLNDTDREPWLALIRRTALRVVWEAKRGGVVITCSALKRYYRDILRGDVDVPHDVPEEVRRMEEEEVEKAKVKAMAGEFESTGEKNEEAESNPDKQNPHLPTDFVFIDGPRDVLMDRMTKRTGHFMKASMLDSQLATLESPVGEKAVVVVSVLDSTEQQVRNAIDGLKLHERR